MTDTDEAVDVAARFAAECITSADGTTAHLPVSLAHDVLAVLLAAADGGEVERLRADLADAASTIHTFAAENERLRAVGDAGREMGRLACYGIPEKVAMTQDEWAAAECGHCAACRFNAALAALHADKEGE